MTAETAVAASGRPAARMPVLRVLLIVVAVLGVAGAAGAYAAGMRTFVVESPSMGQAAPVGSLVVGAPAAAGGVAVGDIVTYRAPDGHGTLYTHRVVGADAAGFRTRGDINGSDDPWAVSRSMVVTRAALVIPGVGWLVRALPLLGPAIALVLALTGLIRQPSTRTACRLLGTSVAAALAVFLLRPLTGFVLLESVAGGGGMRSTIVSTALLPIQVITGDGRTVRLVSGQVGRILLHPDAHGLVSIRSALDLDPLGWCLLGLVCLLPVLRVLVVGVPRESSDAEA